MRIYKRAVCHTRTHTSHGSSMDSHYFQVILNYLRAHPHLGEIFTFLVAFSESLPIIGTAIPGSITMTLIGILIGGGAMPITWSIAIASIAAFSGDTVGYILGFYYNERLRSMWPFKKHPKLLTMGEAFFKSHGGKSIILGRFIGPARCMVPMIAGLLQLSWIRFVIAALPSAIMWAFMYMTPGILLGALAHEAPKGETTKFFMIGIGIILGFSLIFWLIQHFFTQLARAINKITDRTWNYLYKNNEGRFFIRLITNHQKPDDHHQLTLFCFSMLSAILFFILLINVRLHTSMIKLDMPIFHVLQSIRTLTWDKIFVVITLLGAPKTMLMIGVLTTLAFSLKKQWRTATHIFAGTILSAGAVEIFKHLSHSLRPQGFMLAQNTSSFPSGHTTMSFVIVGLISFFVAQIVSKKWRFLPYLLGGVFVSIIAFSRLYLGAHWITDIVGSLLLGLSILFLCIISYRRMPNANGAFHLSPSTTTVLLIVCFGLSWIYNIKQHYQQTLFDTTPTWKIEHISIDAWWTSPLRYSPLYRNNRFGQAFQPFNVQWQGSLIQITQILEKAGWKTLPKHPQLKSTLKRFSSFQAQYHMPFWSWLYHNQQPVLLMIKELPKRKRIIELRLWRSDIYFSTTQEPLWIGTTDVRLPPKKLLSLKHYTKISLADGGGLGVLLHDTRDLQHKLIQISNQNTSKDIQMLRWDGKILLIRNMKQNNVT